MGSQGGGGGVQLPKSQSLARQGSMYNLTLDEVQNQLGELGKPVGSMNLDELLKTVWTVETNQTTGMVTENVVPAPASSLYRQGSLTLSRDLSKKTVEEVWKDIQQNKYNSDEERKARERQPTLGEMTLEDFLAKAGVIAQSRDGNGGVLGVDSIGGPQNSITQHAHWMQYQLPSVQQQPQQQQNMMGVFVPGHQVQQPLLVSDVAYRDNQMAMSPSSLIGALSDTQTPGRKRVAPGDVVEKTVERRQKRMIKNRESAARSRARKQAYTHELENKVSRLEEENDRLKKQKEVEILPSAPPPEPKFQLRRTSSAPF